MVKAFRFYIYEFRDKLLDSSLIARPSFPGNIKISQLLNTIRNQHGHCELYWRRNESFDSDDEISLDLVPDQTIDEFVEEQQLELESTECPDVFEINDYVIKMLKVNLDQILQPDNLFVFSTSANVDSQSSTSSTSNSDQTMPLASDHTPEKPKKGCDKPRNKPPVAFSFGTSMVHRHPRNDEEDDGLLEHFTADSSNVGIPVPMIRENPNNPDQWNNEVNAAFLSPMKRDAADDDVYVGLVNQAMTCYLNSLLQTLFMTPEFRNALYNWEYTGTKDERGRSIPYQLQKLFVLLQTSVGEKTALETKDLTKSFGWDSSHAWDQHDVQELCRVMFDALELKWRRTNQATVITALYQGGMKDYVKCLQCSNENAKNDVFLDLPLAIKPFGSNQAYRSVEEALRGFVQPEVLEGTNQYFCEKCQMKVNAHKGLKITKFPYLLTIQLKRFDFDYVTMHRIKLNDRMTFPDLLNLNPFVDAQPTSNSSMEIIPEPNDQSNDAEVAPTPMEVADDDFEEGQSHSDNAEKMADVADPGVDAAMVGDSDDEGICVGGGTSSAGSPIDGDDDSEKGAYPYDPSLVNPTMNRGILQRYLKDGPYVYELFSIMVHAGSANGGHYYAYIKNMDTKVWYCFNDQVVNRASIEDIRKTYGGAASSPFMYSSYGSSTNAYMLMYRQIDSERNAKLPTNDALPEHILQMIEKLCVEEEAQRVYEEKQRSMISVRVCFYHPTNGTLMEKEFEMHKRDPISKLLQVAHADLAAPFNISIELCRLVRFSKSQETLDVSLNDWKSIHEELPWSCTTPELLLETARSPDSFRAYTRYGLTLKIFVVDVEAGRVRLPKRLLYATKETTIDELKMRIAELLGYVSNDMNLVLDHFRSFRLLNVPTKTLNDEDIWSTGTIFVESEQVGGATFKLFDETTTLEEFTQTHFHSIIDQFKNLVSVKVVLPSINDYAMVGLRPPDQINQITPVQEMSDCNSDVPSVPLPISTSSTSGVSPAVIRGTGSSLCVQPTEECSTASGSTQYITPATSRCPSLEDLDSASSAVSRDQHMPSGFETPDLEITLSGNATPSPQVSPDASPSCIDLDTSTPRLPIKESFDLPGSDMEGICVPPDAQLPIYIPPDPESKPSRYYKQTESDRFDSVLSKIMVDYPYDVTSGCDNATKDGSITPKPETMDYILEVTAIQSAKDQSGLPYMIVDVDKRMSVLEFVQKLAPYVGVASDQFKLYKTYSSTEYECTSSVTSTVDNLTSASSLRIKLGRPLKDGEALIKFLRFELNDLEAFGKPLFEIALTNSSKVADIKRECQALLKAQCGLDVPIEKIRLRDCGSGSMDILRDGTDLQDRHRAWSNDLYLQILEEPETVTTLHHTAVFLRRWCPSTLSIGPVQEIVLHPGDSNDPNQTLSRRQDEELFRQVSRLSNVPLKRLECAHADATDGAFSYCGKLKLLEETTFYGPPTELFDEQNNSSSSSTGHEMNSEGDGGQLAASGDGMDEASCSTTSSHLPHPCTTAFAFGLLGGFSITKNMTRDGTLVYYRDSHEKPKILSDDERKELQIRENTRLRKNQSSYSWRKERALKIYTEISSSMADDLD